MITAGFASSRQEIKIVYKMKISCVWKVIMRTNVDLDDALVKKAMNLTKISTKRLYLIKLWKNWLNQILEKIYWSIWILAFGRAI
jgi:hypothetical protein